MKITPINQVRRPLRRNQKPAAESSRIPPGREVATQRDTAMFRAAEIGGMGANATVPFLVQRLAQLWPTPPRTDPAAASAAYSRTAAGVALSSPSLALVA